MGKKILSVDPSFDNALNRYSPILLVIITLIAAKGLWSELRNSHFMTVLMIIFLIGVLVFWFVWIRTETAGYLAKATQVYLITGRQYLYVRNNNKLFQKKTYIPISFQFIDSIAYLGYVRHKRIVYYIYAVSLHKNFSNLNNPIIFLESRHLPFLTFWSLGLGKPSQQWETRVAFAIKRMIEEKTVQ